METETFKVLVNESEVNIQIFKTEAAYFIPAQIVTPAEIKFITDKKQMRISPLRLNIQAEKLEDGFRFLLNENINLYIVLEGLDLPIFFYGGTPEEYDGRATYFFKTGAVYEVGGIHLQDNESVYIESGAIVKGCITARNANNIKVYGQGILDGSFFGHQRSIFFENCTDITIKDIIMINPTTWMTALFSCKNIYVGNIKQIGEVVSSDGIDIVGCKEVLVENCMLMNNDDCIAIKHMGADLYNPENIRIRSCVLFNSHAGNAIEIGHELRCDEVSGIQFTDIDIIRVDGQGAPFSIHAGDRAHVHDILFENIYVEHYWDKLFDFRVMKSRFNTDKEYGRISNIILKNIHITKSIYNAGYSIAVIGGHDSEHKVSNVLFSDIYVGGEKILSPNQIDLYEKDTENIIFK